MREIGLLIIGIVLISTATYLYLNPYWTTDTYTMYYDVDGKDITESTFRFESGEIGEGYITVRYGGVGSWNEEIRFFIKDPLDKIIYDTGKITGRNDFSFTAAQSGVYKLNFDNSSSDVSKRIFLLINIRTPIYNGLAILAASGITFFVLGIADAYFRKRKRETNDFKPCIFRKKCVYSIDIPWEYMISWACLLRRQRKSGNFSFLGIFMNLRTAHVRIEYFESQCFCLFYCILTWKGYGVYPYFDC